MLQLSTYLQKEDLFQGTRTFESENGSVADHLETSDHLLQSFIFTDVYRSLLVYWDIGLVTTPSHRCHTRHPAVQDVQTQVQIAGHYPRNLNRPAGLKENQETPLHVGVQVNRETPPLNSTKKIPNSTNEHHRTPKSLMISQPEQLAHEHLVAPLGTGFLAARHGVTRVKGAWESLCQGSPLRATAGPWLPPKQRICRICGLPELQCIFMMD